jgi:hypothetical protein
MRTGSKIRHEVANSVDKGGELTNLGKEGWKRVEGRRNWVRERERGKEDECE